MSHTVRRKGNCKDPVALQRSAGRIKGAEFLGRGTFKQFGSQKHTGFGVNLPGYNYPVVIDEQNGDILSDTYGGRWGDPALLDTFNQGCAIEAGKMVAEAAGHTVTEQPLDDGSVKCVVKVGGDYDVAGGSGGGGDYGVAGSGGEL